MMTLTTRLALAGLLCLLVSIPRAGAANGPDRKAERRAEIRQTSHDELFRLDGKGQGKDLFRLDGGRSGSDNLFRLDGGNRQERHDGQRRDGRLRPHDAPADDAGRQRSDGQRHGGSGSLRSAPGGGYDRPDAYRRVRDHGRDDDRDGHGGDRRRRDDRHWDDRRHGGSRSSGVRYAPLGEQRRYDGDDGRRHDSRRPVHHEVRRMVHHLPPRHAVILHGHEHYHYYAGRFYRPWDAGYILVRPPLGLIVLSLPIGSRLVVSAGITYHVFGDVYYRRVPAGYEVVEPIRTSGRVWPAQVEVTTDLLNLRYGPDENEEVIAQVGRYTILNVIGSAPGWLYVEIDGEDVRGWVMERYVTTDLGRG